MPRRRSSPESVTRVSIRTRVFSRCSSPASVTSQQPISLKPSKAEAAHSNARKNTRQPRAYRQARRRLQSKRLIRRHEPPPDEPRASLISIPAGLMSNDVFCSASSRFRSGRIGSTRLRLHRQPPIPTTFGLAFGDLRADLRVRSDFGQCSLPQNGQQYMVSGFVGLGPNRPQPFPQPWCQTRGHWRTV
jgi:hypothetical protein